MKRNLQRALTYLLALFYFFAGLNHFFYPEFYLPLIPPFFPKPEVINLLSGFLEILLGLGVSYLPTRKKAAWGIFMLLICFIPSHVYFIQLGSCIEGGLCVSEWLGWTRLLVIHPLLLYWAFWVHKNAKF